MPSLKRKRPTKFKNIPKINHKALWPFIFLVGILSAATINNYYNLNLNYNKGKFTLLSSNIEQSKETINNYFGNYTAALLDYENNLLDIYFFDVPNEVIYDTVDENGTIVGGGK